MQPCDIIMAQLNTYVADFEDNVAQIVTQVASMGVRICRCGFGRDRATRLPPPGKAATSRWLSNRRPGGGCQIAVAGAG